MHATPAYPVDAVTGCCFLTQRYEIDKGEQVLDLDVYVDALPPFGRLCVSEKAVRLMASTLGMTIPDDDLLRRTEDLQRQLDAVGAENLKLRRAFAQVVNATKLAGLADYTSGLEAVAS